MIEVHHIEEIVAPCIDGLVSANACVAVADFLDSLDFYEDDLESIEIRALVLKLYEFKMYDSSKTGR